MKLPVDARALVIDPTLTGSLSLVTNFSSLKERGVEKVYILNKEPPPDCNGLVYICRPHAHLMKIIADHIKYYQQLSDNKSCTTFHLLLVPRRTVVCERILEEEGVLGDITIGEYEIGFIQLDPNVFSLELDSSFHDLFVDGDYSSLRDIASLVKPGGKLPINGNISRIVALGPYSRRFSSMLSRFYKDQGETAPDSHVAGMIVLDRSVDLITPLMTQLTYQGLVDEVIGIQNSFIELNPSMNGFGLKEKKKVSLSASDAVFDSIKDKSFSEVGPILNATAKRLKNDYDERHAAQSVSELRQFIGKLGNLQQEHQSLQLHVNLRDYITRNSLNQEFHDMLEMEQSIIDSADFAAVWEYVESLISTETSISKILKILCLYCVVNNGLKQKDYDLVMSELCQSYGYEYLLVFDGLEKARLLFQYQSVKSTFPLLKKQFKLKVEDSSDSDIGFVHAIYAPLSVRIVHTVAEYMMDPAKQRKALERLSMLSCDFSEIGANELLSISSKGEKKTYLVLFLGGCTYSEIAALRHIAAKSEGSLEFVILTTQVINSKRILNLDVK